MVTDVERAQRHFAGQGDEATQTPVQTGSAKTAGWKSKATASRQATRRDRRRLRLAGENQNQVVNPPADETPATNSASARSAMNSDSFLTPGPVRHAPRDLHHVHRGWSCAWPESFARGTRRRRCFPQTDFPRVVVMVNNGIMPANEMMATITRPIEEAMKSIPGVDIRAILHDARLGGHQRDFQLGRGHGARGALRDGPALGNPQRPAGHGVHRCFARGVFVELSHHRHQSHQRHPQPDGFVEHRHLHHQADVPANSRRRERWKSSAVTSRNITSSWTR